MNSGGRHRARLALVGRRRVGSLVPLPAAGVPHGTGAGGEERKERPLEEGEEGEVFTVPAGGFATLSFEGLFVVAKGVGRAGPRGARRGSSRPSAERATTPRRGEAPRGQGDHGACGGVGTLLTAPKVSRSAAGACRYATQDTSSCSRDPKHAQTTLVCSTGWIWNLLRSL